MPDAVLQPAPVSTNTRRWSAIQRCKSSSASRAAIPVRARYLQTRLDDQLIPHALHAFGGFGDFFGLGLVGLRGHRASQRDDVVLDINIHAAARQLALAHQL